MNELETSLSLWAICSILIFELLILICLFRCYYNRIRPKKFYVKREEYEYLQDINNNRQTKFPSIILRPPHADELALVGTIRGQNPIISYNKGIQNAAFYPYDEDKKIPQVSSSLTSSSSSSTSQNCFDLQLPIINTAQLSSTDYEINSYSIDNYTYRHAPLPRPIITNFQQYHNDYVNDDVDEHNNQLENYRFQSVRRSEIIHPQVHRIDTSTEFYGIKYSNIVPKSILKSTTSLTPPNDFLSNSYIQRKTSSISSNSDESLENSIEKKISNEQIFSSNLPFSTNYRMKFANVNHLNNIEWEIPREFQTIIHENEICPSNHERTSSSIIESNISITQRCEMDRPHADYLSKNDITQQQAFEY
ncbi:unnamed protein product [Rotaria sp. Silwood1]|nr:unnamed protein product [Rotaria sp. Silwood1]CAF1494333.1 unnamed protein product [Rotaria sp. Silwood1]CAF3650371.1 unnamed protein product [Rotaria sp. Silwood1]CAF4735806.1 unnamed protein product [Rotaria sp. Silwood1]